LGLAPLSAGGSNLGTDCAATRFIVECDDDDGLFSSSGICDTAEEERTTLGVDNSKVEFEVENPGSVSAQLLDDFFIVM
jgi:hypothetical protein